MRLPAGTDASGRQVNTNPWSWFYDNVTSHFPGSPKNGSLLFALFFVFLLWLVAFVMDKKKIYIKV